MAHSTGSAFHDAVSAAPRARRRELGALLRELRMGAGLTVQDVAEALLFSASKVSRLETGQRGASLRDIRDLCDLYHVTDPAQREHLAALAREGKTSGWWQPYDLPDNLATYVGLEADATRISVYQPGVIPGLLHTPDYARAIHEASLPRLSSPEIDRRIEVRLSRQAILTREDPLPPQYWVVIDEGALHRIIGGPAVMRAQLQRVIEATELPNVTVQILTYGAGAHPALDSTFILLEFHDPVPSVVYVEGLVGRVYLEQPQDTERYKKIFERLCLMSLGQRESKDFMTRLITQLKPA